MATITMKQLLEAGVHFGHQTRRWNPKMRPYIYGQRSGVYVIDLQKTVFALRAAYQYVKDLARSGGEIVFVGTKRQAQEVIAEEAQRCGMPYVNQKWLPGTLTNFSTIIATIERYRNLLELSEKGELATVTKKEAARKEKDLQRLGRFLVGLKGLKRTPTALFVVDTVREHVAVAEALRMQLPIVAILDTNADPDHVGYPIPGNDDALRSIRIITSIMAEAVLEGRREAGAAVEAAAAAAAGEQAAAGDATGVLFDEKLLDLDEEIMGSPGFESKDQRIKKTPEPRLKKKKTAE